MTTFYSTAESVLTRTGVDPSDLGVDSSEELEAFVEATLAEIADLMDRTMRQSYLTASPIPAGLSGIAADACADSLRIMVATRQTPVVRIDDFAVRIIQSVVLTSDVKDRLKLYAKGRGLVSADLGQDAISDLPIGSVMVLPDLEQDVG